MRDRFVNKSQLPAATILDSLSSHIAIIDEHGIIIQTNKAWKKFAISNKIQMRPDALGVNYLDICDLADGDFSDNARNVSRGIRHVIEGRSDEFAIDYPCHSHDVKRWFYMRAVPIMESGCLRILVSHENITPLIIIQNKLKNQEAELERKTAALEEANAALRAILRQKDEDKKEMEETFLTNLKEDIIPYLETLKHKERSVEGHRLIELIESGLNEITSPMLRRLSNIETLLTPKEIQIASLIKKGKTTKDIAQLLNLSATTVNFHRRNLRQKLGLKNTSGNLRAYILSLEE